MCPLGGAATATDQVRLRPGPGRPAWAAGVPRGPVPLLDHRRLGPGADLCAGFVLRPVHLLRAVGIPDHLAAAGRARNAPVRSTDPGSGAAGSGGCCRPRWLVILVCSVLTARLPGPLGTAARQRRGGAAGQRGQLAGDPSGRRRTVPLGTPDMPTCLRLLGPLGDLLVPVAGGAVLPRPLHGGGRGGRTHGRDMTRWLVGLLVVVGVSIGRIARGGARPRRSVSSSAPTPALRSSSPAACWPYGCTTEGFPEHPAWRWVGLGGTGRGGRMAGLRAGRTTRGCSVAVWPCSAWSTSA